MMSNVICSFPAEPLQTVNHIDHIKPASQFIGETKTRQETTEILRTTCRINLRTQEDDHTAYRLLLKGPLLFSKATLLTSFLSHWDVIIEL